MAHVVRSRAKDWTKLQAFPPIAFIGGLHRSGTTLLHDALREHPDVSGFANTGAVKNEGQHLQDVYPTARIYGGPGRFGFDPRSHLDETSPLCTAANAERLRAAWAPYWDLSRELLIEKSPPNLVRTRFLQQLFPESYFLIVTRHPIAVTMATLKWQRSSPVELLKHWIACHRRFEQDRPHLKRAQMVRYEDMVQKPAATLRSLYDFLQLSPHQIAVPIRRGSNVRYLQRWRAYLDRNPGVLGDLEAIRPDYVELAERYRYDALSFHRMGGRTSA